MRTVPVFINDEALILMMSTNWKWLFEKHDDAFLPKGLIVKENLRFQVSDEIECNIDSDFVLKSGRYTVGLLSMEHEGKFVALITDTLFNGTLTTRIDSVFFNALMSEDFVEVREIDADFLSSENKEKTHQRKVNYKNKEKPKQNASMLYFVVFLIVLALASLIYLR